MANKLPPAIGSDNDLLSRVFSETTVRSTCRAVAGINETPGVPDDISDAEEEQAKRDLADIKKIEAWLLDMEQDLVLMRKAVRHVIREFDLFPKERKDKDNE